MRKITSLVTNITIAGLRTKLVYPDDTNVTYEYDALSRLTRVKYEGTTIAEYSYDELSRRTLLTYGNDANIVYQYDIGDRLTRITNNMDACSIDVQYSDYDNVGNRRNMIVNGDESQYSYDKLYQLTSVNYPTGFGTDANYFYDCLGNRNSVVTGSTTDYLHNSLNQYTSVGGTNYSYDSKGNLTNDGEYKYYYDCENRLTDVNTVANEQLAHYEYDYQGRRISKIDYTLSPERCTLFSYDGDDLIAEYSGADVLLKKYIYGLDIDEPIMMIDCTGQSEVRYYYHFDGLGSVVALSNNDGELVEQYSYDVFGTPTATSSIGNRFMFTGREYDTETGNYYYRARYYSPNIGRFLQPDPIGYSDGLNLYSYCENNPLIWMDPYGLCKEDRKKYAIWEAMYNAAGWLQTGIHTGLDIAGAFDPTPTSDALNAAGYAGEALAGQGGWGNVAFSTVAFIPYAGDAGKLGRYGRKVEGIYEFVSKTGKKYIGQSSDIAKRIAQYLKSKFLPKKNLLTVKFKKVSGGKTTREIAEQWRIRKHGGIENLENQRNPIGENRQYLMEE